MKWLCFLCVISMNVMGQDVSEMTLKDRQAEILNWFETEVYGLPPEGISAGLEWEKVSEPHPEVVQEDGTLTLKSENGKEMKIPVRLYRPKEAKEALPVALLIAIRERELMNFKQEQRFWPVLQIIRKGWATVAFNVKDLYHDDPKEAAKDAGLGNLDTRPEGPSRGKALSAWAFTASEIRKNLAEKPGLDAKRIAVVGHSRSGKAALLTGARDHGFFMTYSNSSGCGGAANNATKDGEKIANINSTFPNWFCDKFTTWNGKDAELRYDQHHLLGCIAPNRVYVASDSEDDWADPAAEYLSCQLATPIHRFFGGKGLAEPYLPMPEAGGTRHGGTIEYHLQKGPHSLTPFDWKTFLEAASREED